MCSGHNTFHEGCEVDPFTFCFKTPKVDIFQCLDYRDIIDMVATLIVAVSADFNKRLNSGESKIELDPDLAANFNNGNRIKK